jgi:hypothetical protein
MEQLQVPDCKLIEPHVPVFFDPRKGRDVTELFMLGNIEVVKYCTRCDNAKCKALNAKTLQRTGLKLL